MNKLLISLCAGVLVAGLLVWNRKESLTQYHFSAVATLSSGGVQYNDGLILADSNPRSENWLLHIRQLIANHYDPPILDSHNVTILSLSRLEE